MITVSEKSTIASLSELKTKSEEIIKQLADHRVILQKHNKPVAVMLGYKQYALFEKLLEMVEDYTLGKIALERDQKAADSDFLPLEEW